MIGKNPPKIDTRKRSVTIQSLPRDATKRSDRLAKWAAPQLGRGNRFVPN